MRTLISPAPMYWTTNQAIKNVHRKSLLSDDSRLCMLFKYIPLHHLQNSDLLRPVRLNVPALKASLYFLKQ